MFARLCALIVLSAWLLVAGAQNQELEIIELRSATVDRVLPALRPLLEPGASLSGMNNQIFLRASARNRAEIRQALAAIDRPARQLILRVANQRGSDEASRGVSGGFSVGTRGASIQTGVWDSRTASRENASQMVRTLEGGSAYIQIGRSLPVPMRQVLLGPGGAIVSESTVYRDIGQGFYATPHLNGDRVTLEIRQQAERQGARGEIQSQSLATTVAGRLGEWIQLGGIGEATRRDDGGDYRVSTRDVQDQRAIWLKVEEVQ